jgi:ABC-type transport system substrate-binding protein
MKKILLSVICLVMIMAFVFPSFAWYNPATNSEDYSSYNTWGPRVDSVLCVLHSGEVAEYNSFLAELIDLFDWQFTPEQLANLNLVDPGMDTYERLHFTEFGMREIDINNQVFPGSDVNFRTALSKLIDKDTFCSFTLAGLAVAAHSPLWHNPTWRYEPCADFTSEIYDPAAAYALLLANGYGDWDGDGIVEYSSNGGISWTDFSLDLYGRIDDPERTALANLVNDVLTNSAMIDALGGAFDVNLYITTKTTCYQKVMVDYDYTLYTGGWSFGRDPDTLYFLFHSQFATKPSPGASNYINYRSIPFDAAIEAMVTSATVHDAHVACNESQNVFMGDVAMIPVWNPAGYTGILSTVEHAINSPAYGPTTRTGAYMTLLNAYLNDVEYGGSLRWGFMNNFEALSVYNSFLVWDWNILQEIYDSMIGYNPYDCNLELEA